MKIHFRLFLSHYNFKKYQYFLKNVYILSKFRVKITLMLLMTSLTKKKRETGVKSVM